MIFEPHISDKKKPMLILLFFYVKSYFMFSSFFRVYF
jgi:hypothetical protein